MTVSVVIPTFGRAPTLAMAVQSALAQGALCGEVVVVDDASQPAIPRSSLPSDPRIQLLRHPVNRGAGAARNTGVAASSSEFIAFLDSDDLWLPGKLERQVARACASNEPNVVYATAWANYHAGKVSLALPRGAETLREFAAGCWFSPGSTALFTRATFDAIGPFDEDLRRLEDYEWYLRFARGGGRLVVLPEVSAVIRRHRSVDRNAVETAARTILDRYVREASPSRLPSFQDRQLVRSYVDLVTASAHWYGGAHVSALARLSRSLLHRPRLRLQNGPLYAEESLAAKTPAGPEGQALLAAIADIQALG